MGAFDELRTLRLDWFDGKNAIRTDRNWFEPSSFLFVFNKPGKDEYSGGASNVQWAATHNQFFTTVVTPSAPAQTVVGRPVDLPPPSKEEIHGDVRKISKPTGIVGAFAYPELTVPAGQSFVQDYHVYAGPKEYKTISRLSKDVDLADLVMNLEGFWGWFAKMLLLAMNGLYSLGIKYGWAIVVITVILKLVFYPLTAASTRSMKRMSALQPQMKAIQEKYKEDPTKMNQKLQEFMKENRINPLGSCLPLLLTIPVFAGFWKMLYSAIELRGAEFLWACDLSAPDTLAVIPGLNIPINGFALIMIATMMWQSHMTPPSPGVDPAQQKMMRYMPLVIVPFIYNQAAGLTLYWSVQNLLSIIQMKLTRDKPAKPGSPAPAAPAPRRKV
jgi:YidC/Oxa1 family membrane protein insertase